MNWLGYLDKLIRNVLSLLDPTWPQAVLLITLIILCMFSTNIGRLIDRIKKVGKGGISFIDPQDIQPVSPSSLQEVKDKAERISKPNVMTTIKESETNLKSYLSSLNVDETEKISLLITELAETFFYLRCQSVYNAIFGSQIQLLKILNTSRANGLNLVGVEEHFNQISNKFPEFYSNWTLTNYINFLLQSLLIKEQNNNYYITEFGVDFLIWLQRVGFAENKPL